MMHSMDNPEYAGFVKNKMLEINGHVKEDNGDHPCNNRIDTQVIEDSPSAFLPEDCHACSGKRENKTADDGIKKGDGEIIEPADGLRCAKDSPWSYHLPDSHKQEYTKESGKPDDELVVNDENVHEEANPGLK